MSAEKKAQNRAERAEKRRQEEQKDSRSVVIYSVIAVLVVVAAIVMMLFNSGILQRSLTALNVNGAKYTAADVQYYYTSLYNEQARQYLFNSAASVKKQVYDEATGQSWYDHLMELAVGQLTRNTALAQQAEAAGHTLSAEAKASLDDTLAQLETAWISYNQPSRDAFIRANFGSGMTYDRLVSLINMEYLASDYAVSKIEAIQHSDADFQTYYQEHADQLDTITYSQITFRCTLPTTDETGAAIQRTDEEQAAELEELKAGQKALAEEVQAKLRRVPAPRKNVHTYPLKHKVFCGCCLHALSRTSNKNHAYLCRHTQVDESAPCHGLRISETELERIVYELALGQVQAAPDSVPAAAPDSPEGKIADFQEQKRCLYEQFVRGEISIEDYREHKAVLDGELDRLRQTLAVIRAQASQSQAEQDRGLLPQKVREAGRLTVELAGMLIDRVYVFPDGRVEPNWKVGVLST